jgi:UDP-N-acetylmuramate--alanine ligase
MQHVHFIGIGGVGMNGLAQLAVHAGCEVSGSDRGYDPEAEVFRCLAQLGIRLLPQDGSGIGAHTEQVVFSTAIEPGNPDLLAAERFGIPLLHRAGFLKELIGSDRLIAVAGTAGKTTTTGMLGWLLENLGMDPTVYNGAAVLNWNAFPHPGNVRQGRSNLWVIEADESDRSFLNFHPIHSIITNISRDHYELPELHAMFEQFRSQTAGIVVNGPDLRVDSSRPGRFVFNEIEFTVPVIGRHNLENALCAVRLCAALDLDMEGVRDALSRFKGIERRLETIGCAAGITIIDDYAHNPAKIGAALSAVSETAVRVHAYWRPHGFAPLHQGLQALTETFALHWKQHGGSIHILPVYYAGGTVERPVTSEDLVNHLNSAGVPAVFVPDYDALANELHDCARSGDTILGMGARDPELPRFAQRLFSTWKKT